MKRFILGMALTLFATLALAQTVPNGGITQGQVWSVPQWVSAWQSKADTASPAFTGTATIGGVVVPTVASPAFTGTITLNGVSVPTVASPPFTGTPTVNGIAIPTYPQTAAEVTAGVTPSSYIYPAGNVPRYGCDPTGVASSQACLANALAAANPTNGGNGIVIIPAGTYQTTATLNRPAGVYIQGAGWEATVLKAFGNYAVIATTGSQSNVLSNGGVRDLTVWGTWGANNANTLSYGISESWTNRSQIINVRIHGTNIGMYGIALWQNEWLNIHIDGAGTQQNNTGVYLDQLPTTFPVGTSNAVQAVHVVAQGVAGVGFRLLNPNGSKWVSCEAENGTYGWLIGNTATGMYPIQFAHFVNDLADTNSAGGWVFQQGSNASAVNDIHLTNIWAGNSGGIGVLCDGCNGLTFANLQLISNAQGALKLNNSVNNIVSVVMASGNNTAIAAGIGDIWVAGGSYNKVSKVYSNMANGTAVSLLESAATNNNDFEDTTANQNATLVGANSTIHHCRGCTFANIVATAGASPWTSTSQNVDCLWVITTVNGLSALTASGVSLPITANSNFFQKAGKVFIATWATTAPVFTCVPQN